MAKLQDERIDLFSGMIVHNESCKLPGHERRMKAHERRIHKAIGPVAIQHRDGRNEPCKCPICEDYKASKTAGPKH